MVRFGHAAWAVGIILMVTHLRWFLILSSLFSVLGLAVCAAAQTGASVSRPVEIRAVWMDRNSIPKTEQGIRHLIRSYANAGINLVHPEVIFNGYSAYPSSFLKQKDLWPGVDMLRVLTDEAHRNGIEVHPWVWVFRAGYTADPGGILPQHPDWAMMDKKGGRQSENGSYWLSPCHEAVRTLLKRSYEELVQKYPVDGIELDYVRYPSPDWGYEPLCREKFQGKYGIDPLDIQPLTPPVLDWYAWRENLVSSFVQEVSTDLRKIRPKLKVSAAVASYPDSARRQYLQNWQNWAANKWVDFLAPMDYTGSSMDFAKRVIDSVTQIDNTALIASGIGLLEMKGTDQMLQQIEIARDQSAQGVTLFATAYLDANRLKALATGPFRTKAELPVRAPVHAAQKLSNMAARKLKTATTVDQLQEANSHLRDARDLIEYQKYRQEATGYVAPTPPPIQIPTHIVPLPETQVPVTATAPVIDGKLDDAAWQSAAKISLDYAASGGDAAQPTEVYLLHDAQNLYIAYRAHERRMNEIKAKVTERDGAVFYEDSAEFFLDPAGLGTDYYQFSMNTLGTKYEAHGYDPAFNADWQGAAAKESDAWTAEMAVPFSALKASTPSGTWRANFCRNRAVITQGPNAENMCWAVPYGSFHTPERFGRLTFN